MSDNFKSIIRNLPTIFDTEDGQIIGKEFNSPCIIGSSLYQRQTGDLTSNFLKVLTDECVKDLLNTEKDKCRIQYITHMTLEEADKNALEEYLKNKSNLDLYLEKLMDRSINNFLSSSDYEIDKQSRLDIFTTLIGKKTIIIKFAFPKEPHSIFHKKTGIFHFDWGDKISFVGGNNDTVGGLKKNIETLETRQSWLGENDLKIINKREKDFIESWNNRSLNFITRPLSQKNLERLIIRADKFKKNKNIKISDKKFNKHTDIVNNNQKDDKWSFQEDAVNIFLEKKSGILEMATGTGKTRTTFKIIDELLSKNKINKIIIQMKGKELLDQWIKELNEWKIYEENPIRASIRTLRQDMEKKDIEKFLSNFENIGIDVLFISQSFLPDLLNHVKNQDLSKTLIVHDEIHNLPTENMLSKIKGLQKNIGYRLGLSATVKDEYDTENRTNRLFEEVGPIIFTFGLEEAIKRGILVQFDFDFRKYELTETEQKEKKDWIVWRDKQIRLKKLSEVEINEIFRREVSKINKKAINKLKILDDYVKSKPELLEKCFIFVLEMDYGDLLLNKLIKHMPEIKTHYNEHADKKNLIEFARGNLKCIINCKMLSEGINMKSLSNIVLVSSESKRQLIQRLGRVLRIDEENNPDKRAFVLDFIEDKQYDNKDGSDFKRYEFLEKLSKIKKEYL
jgi:superfamily II DNA or RNA helicase